MAQINRTRAPEIVGAKDNSGIPAYITSIGNATSGIVGAFMGTNKAPAQTGSGTPTWLVPAALGTVGLIAVVMLMGKKKGRSAPKMV